MPEIRESEQARIEVIKDRLSAMGIDYQEIMDDLGVGDDLLVKINETNPKLISKKTSLDRLELSRGNERDKAHSFKTFLLSQISEASEDLDVPDQEEKLEISSGNLFKGVQDAAEKMGIDIKGKTQKDLMKEIKERKNKGN